MKIKPYLVFNGNAEEALNFYAQTFNGTIGELVRYSEFPDMESPAEYANMIIHANLNINDCTVGMADALPGTKADFGSLGHQITVYCDTEQQLKDIFAKLAQDGTIYCELSQPCYAKLYGEVVDKFGVFWALIIE